MSNDTEDSVFTKIIQRELPADIVFENDRIIVIKTIQPHAKIHLLAIPKYPYRSIDELLQTGKDKELLWELFSTISTIAHQLGIAETGYKIVCNTGQDAGQSVPHLHIHMLGGERLKEF